MSCFLKLLMLTLFITNFVLASSDIVKTKKSTSDVKVFTDSSQNIIQTLKNKIFNKYSEYTIENIRQGEIGEAQAYFIRLIKPFSDSKVGVCFIFISEQLQSQPHDCQKAE